MLRVAIRQTRFEQNLVDAPVIFDVSRCAGDCARFAIEKHSGDPCFVSIE
jgi:hypothetical protein